MLNDGAAIYTLSCQDGTIVENNYIDNTGVGRSLYPDQGSGGILFRNNVALDTPYAFVVMLQIKYGSIALMKTVTNFKIALLFIFLFSIKYKTIAQAIAIMAKEIAECLIFIKKAMVKQYCKNLNFDSNGFLIDK